MGKYSIVHTGLIVSEPLSEAEWQALGMELAKRGRSHRWQLGDWWLLHKGNPAVRYVFLEHLDIDLKTVQNLASVCAAFTHEERIPELSIKHHEAVMGLPKEVRASLLQEAAAEGLTVEELRDRARKEARKLNPEELSGRRRAAMAKETYEEEVDEVGVRAEALDNQKALVSIEPLENTRAGILPLKITPLQNEEGAVRALEDGSLEHRQFPEVRVVMREGRILLWNPSLRMIPAQARALAEVLWFAAATQEKGVVVGDY